MHFDDLLLDEALKHDVLRRQSEEGIESHPIFVLEPFLRQKMQQLYHRVLEGQDLFEAIKITLREAVIEARHHQL